MHDDLAPRVPTRLNVAGTLIKANSCWPTFGGRVGSILLPAAVGKQVHLIIILEKGLQPNHHHPLLLVIYPTEGCVAQI